MNPLEPVNKLMFPQEVVSNNLGSKSRYEDICKIRSILLEGFMDSNKELFFETLLALAYYPEILDDSLIDQYLRTELSSMLKAHKLKHSGFNVANLIIDILGSISYWQVLINIKASKLGYSHEDILQAYFAIFEKKYKKTKGSEFISLKEIIKELDDLLHNQTSK